MIWKAWTMHDGRILIANVDDSRVDECLERWPEDILFEAELVTE